MATMPNVVGMNVSQATATLILAGITPDNGLVPGNFVNIGYFDLYPVATQWVKQNGTTPGTVLKQSPVSGTAGVALSTEVSIQVSNFPVAVADLYSAGGYTFFPVFTAGAITSPGGTPITSPGGTPILP